MSAAPRAGASLKIGFAGTSEFAAIILHALLDAGRNVLVVYTQPDRPAGRGRKMRPSPTKMLALERQIEVRQPATLRDETSQGELAAFELDVLIVAAYGLILPRQVLAIPKLGCINVHASLLPRWRGAAPVERAIMAGDEQTGVCIMQMDAGLDTGPVLARASCPVGDEIEGPQLERALAELGARCLLDCLNDLESLTPQPQDEAAASYAAKLTAADAIIDWSAPAHSIQRQVRALCGRLPATATVDDLQIKILEAGWATEQSNRPPGTVLAADRKGIRVACGDGVLIVRRLQLNRGKGRPLSAADAVNGYPEIFTPGATLANRY